MATIKSIEEKAKAYDEAYKKVAIRFGSNVADEIFLKESEDERIRKELIFYLRYQHSISENFEDIGKWIAWLEKQGEHNMGISEATKQELEDNLNKALEKETPESCNKFLDEQGEQKPVEWSIFDYRTWQYIVSDVLTKRDGIGQYLDDGECKKIAKYMQEEWSKKLCLIQHTVWSEEDDSKLKEVLYYIEYVNKTNVTFQQKDLAHLINWLKSIKDSHTWKPSDEQMDVLLDEANAWTKGCPKQKILESLYNDLKKLRGK